jgi:hypothetical protein
MPAAHLMLQAFLDMEARGVVAVRSDVGVRMHSRELDAITPIASSSGLPAYEPSLPSRVDPAYGRST